MGVATVSPHVVDHALVWSSFKIFPGQTGRRAGAEILRQGASHARVFKGGYIDFWDAYFPSNAASFFFEFALLIGEQLDIWRFRFC